MGHVGNTKRRFRETAGIILAGSACAGLAILVAALGLFRSIDWSAYAARFPSGTPYKSLVTVVDMDEESVALLGPWPFDRRVFSIAIQNAIQSGAVVVAVDVIFSSERSPDGDAELAALARSNKSIVFAYQSRDGEPRLYPRLMMAGPMMGHIDAAANNRDSLLATIPVIRQELSLPLQAASIYCQNAQPQCRPKVRLSETDMVYGSAWASAWGINFNVPTSTLPKIPFYRLVAGNIPELKGKIVVVSASASIFDDLFPLPLEKQRKAGAVAFAYAIETAITGTSVYVLPRWVIFFLLGLVNGGLLFLCSVLPKRRNVLLLASTLTFAVVQWAAFKWLYLHVPLTIWLGNMIFVWMAAAALSQEPLSRRTSSY